ncbi:MAG: hypothetical protein GKR90_22925 [Pseudomonadales bacterium]|nr:hypothetical protein [Pseudomonadales bacterium]
MNTPKKKNTASPTPGRRNRAFHKVTGLCLILPVLLLVITGIPLELSSQPKLGSTGVPFTWVHEAYGVDLPREALVQGGVIQLGDLFLVGESKRSVRANGQFLAAYAQPEFTMILTDREWLLVAVDPGITVDRGGYPDSITRAGFGAGIPMIETATGPLSSTDYGASWHPALATVEAWPQPTLIRTDDVVRTAYGASVVNWERWLQDLHSGRFFGQIGIWIMTAAGIAFVMLAISGFLLWFRTLRR